ncbi:hypothetical protein FPQ18DRAFT_325629 [Pyronema domesticum]|nr:hypothetical protein FPQ18DRAFT_325629 [Pyronema domesticum]
MFRFWSLPHLLGFSFFAALQVLYRVIGRSAFFIVADAWFGLFVFDNLSPIFSSSIPLMFLFFFFANTYGDADKRLWILLFMKLLTMPVVFLFFFNFSFALLLKIRGDAFVFLYLLLLRKLCVFKWA